MPDTQGLRMTTPRPEGARTPHHQRLLRHLAGAACLVVGSMVAMLQSAPLHAAAAIPEHGLSPALRESLREALAEPEAFDDPIDALHWVLSMQQRLERYMPDRAARIDLLRKIRREATRTGLAPELILAVIQVESAFKPTAVSHAGARGLMQVMPFWKREIGEPGDNLLDQDTSLRYGATILAHYLKREKGDITDALARYNGSLGKTWYPERVMRAWTTRWWYQAPAPFVAERLPNNEMPGENTPELPDTAHDERRVAPQDALATEAILSANTTGNPLSDEEALDAPASRSLAAGGSP